MAGCHSCDYYLSTRDGDSCGAYQDVDEVSKQPPFAFSCPFYEVEQRVEIETGPSWYMQLNLEKEPDLSQVPKLLKKKLAELTVEERNVKDVKILSYSYSNSGSRVIVITKIDINTNERWGVPTAKVVRAINETLKKGGGCNKYWDYSTSITHCSSRSSYSIFFRTILIRGPLTRQERYSSKRLAPSTKRHKRAIECNRP